MGKQHIPYSQIAPHERHRHASSGHRWLAILALSVVAIWALSKHGGTWFPLTTKHIQIEDEKPFDWADVSTKRHLDYHSCYDGAYQCARLELPMDYWNGTTNATISLAVIKKPAVVPVTDPRYGGAILFNPGGPGGSGVGFLLLGSDQLRDVIEYQDGSDAKYYDYVSFDPRGVGYTLPSAQCSEDLVFKESWALRVMEEGVFSSSDAAFGRLWSMAMARGRSCSLPKSTDEPDFKKYVSTSSVARDMLEIVERHGEWREQEAKRLVGLHGSRPKSGLSASSFEVLKRLKYRPGEEKIQYWGFSYGSYLGNTFAAMFPNRVERLIVDGVVDADDYKRTLWQDNLVDAEKDMDTFYYYCARAGFPKCALANQTGNTTEQGVKQRFLSITESLYHNPLPIIADPPDVITFSDVKNLILTALYTPVIAFPAIAELMADIECGDARVLAKIVQFYHYFNCALCRQQDESQVTGLSTMGMLKTTETLDDITMAIACGDGDDQSWVTKADFQKHIDKLSKMSPTIGEIWANIRLQCVHYNVRPYHRFEGPWEGNTSHPILEIGNTADPVTPGRYAKKMAEGFPGAGVLIQESAGHCSLSTPSRCTQKYVRNYFQTGELPEAGTVCEADAVPFESSPGTTFDVTAMEARRRSAAFSRALIESGGGLLSGRFGNVPWLD